MSDSSETESSPTRASKRQKSLSSSEQDHLSMLKSALIDERPPYCLGTLVVDAKGLLIFYSGGTKSGRVDFANPTEADLNSLMQACDPARFGHGGEDIYDETVRKAGKLDSDRFATKLDLHDEALGGPILDAIRFGLLRGSELLYKEDKWPREEKRKDIRTELYKLNVYGKDGFFKPHKDTPRSSVMFGSLVIILPTVHSGGELIFRHNSKQWTFDSSDAIAGAAIAGKPSIVYAAFYSDVEHEVGRVASGFRVTLTYNLYFTKPQESSIPRIPTSPTIPSNASLFQAALESSLQDENFLPKGGMLGFGLQHLYPIAAERSLRAKDVQTHLKGVDALVLSTCIAAGLVTRVCVLYDGALLMDEQPCDGVTYKDEFLYETLAMYGGRVVNRRSLFRRPYSFNEDGDSEDPDTTVQPVAWVTELTHFNKVTTEYLLVGEGYFGNEAGISYAYAKLVLIADVGPAGQRATRSHESGEAGGSNEETS